MGTVTNSIGSAGGRDYSTIALWEAALPANLVTDGNSYVGQCYNDSEFVVAGNVVTISGITTDSSHTILLTTGPGQSFRDNANAQTNALRYNASNGVGIRSTINAATTVVVNNNYASLSNLQFQYDGNGNYGSALVLSLSGNSGPARAGTNLTNCIVSAGNTAANLCSAGGGYAGFGVVANCLFICATNNYFGAATSGMSATDTVGTIVNCTSVSLGSTGGPKFSFFGTSSAKLINCAGFGALTGFSDSATAAGNNNATDFATILFGSSNQTSLTFANQFVATTSFASADLNAAINIKNFGLRNKPGITQSEGIPCACNVESTNL